MNPKAYLIFGPESSGTRMITQYVALNANAFGDWDHYQSLDKEKTFEYIRPESNVVWRRSLPHGGEWPNISKMIELLERKGFQVVTIGTLREKQETIDSQFRNGHIKTTEQGNTNYHKALSDVKKYARVLIQYEDFCSSKACRQKFLNDLGLKFPKVEVMKIRPLQSK